MTELNERFANCSDLNIREIKRDKNAQIHLIYLSNFVDISIIDCSIIKPLLENIDSIVDLNSFKDHILKGKIYHTNIYFEEDLDKIEKLILDGKYVILCNNLACVFEVTKQEKRSIADAPTEVSVKGARDSFIESIETNIALVRRRVKLSSLKTLNYEVGVVSKSKVTIMYIDGLSDKNIVENIKSTIKNMDVSSISSPAELEENIIPSGNSIFPQYVYTERPDKFCANLLEGRVGIFIDGFPTGYIVPGTFPMLMHDPDEYTTNFVVGSIKRVLRYIATVISLVIPGFYVAVTAFHPNMLPTKLTASIVNSKQNVPFPTFIEILIMLIAFEMLLEAGARLPKNIGQTISILGGLVIGEAAVNAKFVSPAVIVIVAAAGICGFLIPNQDLSNAVRISRFCLVILSAVAGLFGLSFGITAILYYLCSLKPFEVPYFYPLSSSNGDKTFKDTLFRNSLNVKRKKQ